MSKTFQKMVKIEKKYLPKIYEIFRLSLASKIVEITDFFDICKCKQN